MELIIIGLIIYFFPTIVAWMRGKKNGWGVIVVNLFLGWTLIGWVIALAWAFWEKEENGTDPNYGYISEREVTQKSVQNSEERTMNEVKKEKLSKLLDDWADWKITEEEYKIKKEKIIIS